MPADQQEILRKLDACEFDVIFDVRSKHYHENWRLAGGEHLPDATAFDPERLATQNITSVAFYCWNDPWQSEPAAQWFAQQYGAEGVQVYDIKGLSYLDDIPGMCEHIDGDEAAINEYSPHCAVEGGVGSRSADRCTRAPPPPVAADDGWSVEETAAASLVGATVLALLIAGCCMCGKVHETETGGIDGTGGKLSDPWAQPSKGGKMAMGDDEDDDCEMSMSMCMMGAGGFSPVVPAAAVIGTDPIDDRPLAPYPVNLPGTPDSEDEPVAATEGFGAHGMPVTEWVSDDEDAEEEQLQPTEEEAETNTDEADEVTAVAAADTEAASP